MKKLLVAALLGSLLYALPVSASEINIADMDFTTLSELKNTVDAEYNSRPEAEPFPISKGYYTVGQDLAPGHYYVATVVPDEDGYGVRMHVYADKAQFDARPAGYYGEYIFDDYFTLGEEPRSMALEEGNYLYVEGPLMFSARLFEISDYYTYEVPEGTYVPAGAYMVGEGDDKDLPAGTFTAFASDVTGGDVKIYNSQETFAEDGSWHLGYDKHCELRVSKGVPGETFVLEEGSVLLIEKPVIMKKGNAGSKLNFD